MSIVTQELIENTYDTVSMMALFSQRLFKGAVPEDEADEMAWLLGSATKRLRPVINLLEEIETEQSQLSADLAIVAEVNDLQRRWDALKAKLECA